MPVTGRMEMGAGDAHDPSLQPLQELKDAQATQAVLKDGPAITVEIVDLAEKPEGQGCISPCVEHADSQPVLHTSPRGDSHVGPTGNRRVGPTGDSRLSLPARQERGDGGIPTTVPPQAALSQPAPPAQQDCKENEAPEDDNSLMCYLASQEGQSFTLSGPDGQLVALPKGVNIHVEARVAKPVATISSNQQDQPRSSVATTGSQQPQLAVPQQLQQPAYFSRPSPDGQFVLPGPTIGPSGQLIHSLNAELKGTPHPRSGTAYPSRGAVYVTNSLPAGTATPRGVPHAAGLHPIPLGQHAQPQVVLNSQHQSHLLGAQLGYKVPCSMHTPVQLPQMRPPYSMRTPVQHLTLNSSGSDATCSSPDYPVPPRPPYNTPEDSLCQHLTPPTLPLGPLSVLNNEDSPYNEYDIGKHQHNAKERFRRSRIKKACDVMRSTVPGMTCKTDKATVFEFGAQYILFLKSLVGQEHDKEFLRRYSPY